MIKKAEAALRSSSRSETVSKDDPIDLVAAEHDDSCVDNQSSTVPTEQNPDSHDPLRFQAYMPEDDDPMEDAVEDPEDADEKEDKTESS